MYLSGSNSTLKGPIVSVICGSRITAENAAIEIDLLTLMGMMRSQNGRGHTSKKNEDEQSYHNGSLSELFNQKQVLVVSIFKWAVY